MSMRTGIASSAMAVAALAVVLLTPSGAAAPGLQTGFWDVLFTSSAASTRATWLDYAVKDRAGIIRINVPWRRVVGSHPPVTPTNPADPDYSFGWLDAAVKDARARGLDVMMTVYNAPDWAEGKNRPRKARAGSWKPNPRAFGQFAHALATRYSGSFPGLPRVRYFEAWNEPNVSIYLAPQWVGNESTGPELYRHLLNSFYLGIHTAQPSAKVIGGATSPLGDPRDHPRVKSLPRMRPLIFLRKLFCLNASLGPTKCGTNPHLDILSHHPINFLKPPSYRAVNPNDVEVADLHNLRDVLKAAERTHHVSPGGRHPLWVTELWWYTNPPAGFGVPVQEEARWLEQAMYMLWKQGASTIVHYELKDPNWTGTFGSPPSGVFFHSGEEKPSYTSYRFPFVTRRLSPTTIGAWGKAPRAGTLQIQRQALQGWKTIGQVNVHGGEIFTPTLKLNGHAKLRATIGQDQSLVWQQG